MERGYVAEEQQATDANRMWHALAQGEAELMRNTLFHLRRLHAAFSHGIVHDAIFVEASVPEQTVQAACHTARAAIGLPHAVLARKSWDKARKLYEQRLREHSYRTNVTLRFDRLGEPTASSSDFKVTVCQGGAHNLWSRSRPPP